MWKYLVGVLVLLAVGVVLLPLRQVTNHVAPELTAREISGSVWKGRLAGARWRGIELGDLELGLDPRALLGGKLRLDFDRGASQLTGRLGTDNGIHSAERLNGAVRVPLASAFASDLDVALINAAISVDGAGRCHSAGGKVATRISGIPGLGASPTLTGSPRCDEGALLLPLRSADDRVGFDVHLWADRRYRADIIVNSNNIVTRLALAAAGFSVGPNGSRRTIEGQL